MKKFYISLLALISAMTLAANATTNEAANMPDWMQMPTVEIDTVVIDGDTILCHHHPEPMFIDAQTIRKAALAATCYKDSVIGLDTVGNYTSLEEYEYDEKGRTVGETKYTWTNNVKTGTSRYWKHYNNSGVENITVNFTWDATRGIWIGRDSLEKKFNANNQQLTEEKYVWNTTTDNWRPNTLQEYEYDPTNKQKILSRYSIWNASDQALRYSTRYIYKYDNTPQLHEIENSYWEYQNGEWIGKTKTEREYDGNNMTLLAKYSGMTNGKWNGTSKEMYTFNANNQQTEYIKCTWKNGDWLNQSRTTYAYENGSSQPTEQISYTWNSIWVEQKRTVKLYSGSKLYDHQEYTWNNGWVGTSRTTNSWWESGKDKEIITYAWDTSINDWVNKNKTAYDYPDSKTTIETHLTWSENTWVGVSKSEISYHSGSLIAHSMTYIWYNDDWFGVIKQDNTYDSSNRPLTEKIDMWYLTNWRDSLLTTYNYGTGDNKLVVKAKWNSAKSEWQSTDSLRRTVVYVKINNKDLVESDIDESWTLSGGWAGKSKTINQYDEKGNILQKNTYKFNTSGWYNSGQWIYKYKDMKSNLQTYYEYCTWNNSTKKWVGSSKNEYEYDDSNRKVMTATYKWNTSKENWEGVTKSKDVYTNGRKTSTISYKWDTSLWDWIGSSRMDNISYDAAGHVTEKIVYQYDQSSTKWVESSRTTSEYDTQNRIIMEEQYSWLASASDWCVKSTSETNYDEEKYGGRQRFKLDITYQNCTIITKYDYKRYYYSCDNYYDIQYVNYDNTLLKAFHTLEGETPYYNLKVYGTPQKPDDKQYTYTFKSWDQPVTVATGDKVYTATFTATPRKFTVTFYNEDKTQVIEERSWDYGSTPTCAAPTKSNTAQYTFKFKGWSDGIVSVDGDTSYVAMFDTIVNRYAIDYFNGETKILRDSVEYGKKPVYSGETPTKDATAQYTYTFSGWDNELATVTGDAAYHAQFSQTTNKYAIIFYDENGTTELQNSEWEYGSVPTYSGTTPTKTGDAQYSYTFDGWDKEVIMVTAEASYKAKYAQSVNKYLVTFYDEDGTTELQSKEWEYGATPEYTGTTPTKDATAQYTYTFTGWTPTIESVTQAAGYSATFSSIINNYTVTFEVKGNSLLSQSVPNVPYGTKVLTLVEQVKTALGGDSFEDDSYIYSFAGIEGPDKVVDENAIIEADETFYVLYSKTPKTPTGVDQMVNGKSSNGKLLIDGILYIQRDGKLYTVQGQEVENK